MLESLPQVAIVRVRLPIDSVPHPRNFVTKLAGYRSVVDVTNSATIVDDLVRAIEAIIAQRANGVFHAVNPGLISNHHVLERYRALVDRGHAFDLVSEAELYARGLALAPRSNCQVASARLEQLGIRFEPIDAALERVLHEYGRLWRSAPTLRA